MPTDAQKALDKLLDKAGTDPRQWTPDTHAQHSKLSDDAMREQHQK